MPAAAVIGGSALLGAASNIYSSNKAAGAAKSAANQANAAQQAIYNQNYSNFEPYLQAGQQALTGLNRLASGDYSGFSESPDYQYALQAGTDSLDRSAAARGNLFGGGNVADQTSLASGLATQNLNNYRNSLYQLAGMGQSSASALAGVGQNYANAYGGNLNNAANATGSAALSNGNTISGLLTGIGGLAANYLSPGNSRNSSYSNLLAGQANTGQGSSYNFGNNLYNFANWT